MIFRNGSHHALVEREDRIVRILSTVGLGEPVAERDFVSDTSRENTMILTDTGIIVVRDRYSDRVVTMFPATFVKAKWVLNGKPLTPYMKKRIEKNQKIFADLA